MKQKCEEIGFQHCWEDTTPNIIYLTMPPQYPPKERVCVNCGRKEVLITIQTEETEWQERKLNEIH